MAAGKAQLGLQCTTFQRRKPGTSDIDLYTSLPGHGIALYGVDRSDMFGSSKQRSRADIVDELNKALAADSSKAKNEAKTDIQAEAEEDVDVGSTHNAIPTRMTATVDIGGSRAEWDNDDELDSLPALRHKPSSHRVRWNMAATQEIVFSSYATLTTLTITEEEPMSGEERSATQSQSLSQSLTPEHSSERLEAIAELKAWGSTLSSTFSKIGSLLSEPMSSP
ncbi:uncharacterized protein AMSG_11622 [Thecamonas trahens ATCC 50062]|uniref:Uncharacterized protein n=1 Tax=Thecamonas trahens ATCC 50062 TaxID=461836 RepID=A0A0L0DED0_THETB|nr:hypothetical protein AMSG_11622 [Thecamonas trahens ATCC 50062]KNC50654.1 hypothetical protein AMSG_11622 [Thecamonas trahens ATCC 50062]|eukprot:XP_013762601.1 hypothetical protein AMSG_11622 [Thecamonas trahens ATCC 50062]